MGLRTVRLDDDTEKILKQVTKKTGLHVSATLKRGILTLRGESSPSALRVRNLPPL